MRPPRRPLREGPLARGGGTLLGAVTVSSVAALMAGAAVLAGAGVSAGPAAAWPWAAHAAQRAGQTDPGGQEQPAVSAGPTVHLRVQDDNGFPAPPPVLDGLAPGTVLTMRVSGFEPHAAATARQCVQRAPVRCENAIPVQFDGDGVAQFQYLVVDQPLGPATEGACRPTSTRCTVVVADDGSDDRAEVDTVFGGPAAPPGRIRVEPSRGLRDGQVVTVSVEGFPPGAHMTALVCAAPATGGPQRCGEPGPHAPLTVGPDGRGSAPLTVRSGPVGTAHVACRNGSTCGVSVTGPDSPARARVAAISFAAPAGAAYDPARVAVALAAAAALLSLAAWWILRTDWSPPSEADAPALDAAAYADLDAMVEAQERDEALVGVDGSGPPPSRRR